MIKSNKTQNGSGFPLWIQLITLVLAASAVLGNLLPSFTLSFGSLFPFRLLLPIYIGALGFAIVAHTKYKIGFPKITVALLGVVCLGVIGTLLGLIFGQGPEFTQLIVLLLRVVLLFTIVTVVITRTDIYRVWALLTCLALLSFMLVSIELTTGWHIAGSQLQTLPERLPYSNFVTAWYTNINDLAFFLLMSTTPALVMGLHQDTNLLSRLFYICVWIIGAVLTIHLNSRAVMIAYVMSVVTAFTLTHADSIRRQVQEIPSRAGKVSIPICGIALAAMFVFIPNPVPDVGSSIWIRWQLQKAAILEGGLFGHGFGSSIPILELSSIDTGGIFSPHSWYGAFAIDAGIIGLILFFVFYAGLVTRLLRTANLQDPIPVMSITALISLPVAGLGPSNVLYLPTFWIILGVSIVTLRQYNTSNSI